VRGDLHHVELWVPDLARACEQWGWLLSLVHPRQMLTAGSHSFRLRWRTPARTRPGSRLYLAAAWASHQPPGFSEEQLIAHLVLD